MVTVITYGTFDLFHLGHLRLLERAAGLGDRLAVGVSTDEFNEIKGKKCIQPYVERATIVGALGVVDSVFPEKQWDQKVDDVKRLGADVFVMGDDWKGKFDYLQAHCKVVYLARTVGVSTTDRKELIYSGQVSAQDWSGLTTDDDI
jgi:glycerol-3-phosphate cytidylyltransferase